MFVKLSGAFAAALIVAYGLFWVGGAAEAAFHDEPPVAERCSMDYAYSGQWGEEEVRWLGGGFLGTPGRVCVSQTDPRSAAGVGSESAAEWPISSPPEGWALLIAPVALVMVAVETYDRLGDLEERRAIRRYAKALSAGEVLARSVRSWWTDPTAVGEEPPRAP